MPELELDAASAKDGSHEAAHVLGETARGDENGLERPRASELEKAPHDVADAVEPLVHEVEVFGLRGGTEKRQGGVHANAAMWIDPHLKNTCFIDKVGGSVSFYDTRVKLVPVA